MPPLAKIIILVMKHGALSLLTLLLDPTVIKDFMYKLLKSDEIPVC